jgi:HK97 family phage major capsid protein
LKIEEFKENQIYSFQKQIDFSKKESQRGEFEGILVKYNNNKLAHKIFKFAEHSLKINDGKTLFILWQHGDNLVPVGTMVGQSDSEGFKVKAKLDLSLRPNGDANNPAAWSLYSLMKDMGAKFDLSVGGYITVREIVEKDNGKYVNIKEFDAYEGSIVMRGAVEGSKITNVFGEDKLKEIIENHLKPTLDKIDKKINNNNGGNKEMGEKEILQFMKEQFANLQTELLKATTEKEALHFKENLEKLEEKFNELSANTENKEAFASINEKLEQFNEIILGLKQNYQQAKPQEYNAFKEVADLFLEAKEQNKALKLQDGTNFTFAATVDGQTSTIKPAYVNKIIERIQDSNPILKEVSFMPISDGSLTRSREELGLPTVGIVNSDEVRYETTTVDADDFEVKIYQWYVLPVIQNLLAGTNYVGFVSFALKRSEYAMSLHIANKLLNGTGVKEPLGILNDPAITKTKSFDIRAAGDEKDDKLFAKKLKSMFNDLRVMTANNAKWYMVPGTWEYITNLQDAEGRFYFQDIMNAAAMKIRGQEVVLIESEAKYCGLYDLSSPDAFTDKPIVVFGDVANGIEGIVNNKLSISLKDQLTTKGYTKYYMEKGAGMGVKLPENFTIGKASKDAEE